MSATVEGFMRYNSSQICTRHSRNVLVTIIICKQNFFQAKCGQITKKDIAVERTFVKASYWNTHTKKNGDLMDVYQLGRIMQLIFSVLSGGSFVEPFGTDLVRLYPQGLLAFSPISLPMFFPAS